MSAIATASTYDLQLPTRNWTFCHAWLKRGFRLSRGRSASRPEPSVAIFEFLRENLNARHEAFGWSPAIPSPATKPGLRPRYRLCELQMWSGLRQEETASGE